MEQYNDGFKNFIMTPEQARKQIKELGYEKPSDMPIFQSDYLMALFIIANSETPLDLAKVRDMARANMRGRR